MEKIKNFFSKYGLAAFITLFLIMMIRGCSKNGTINKLEKHKVILTNDLEQKRDSIIDLKTLLISEEQINLIDYKAKSEILDWVNNSISKYDRNKSMMELQFDIIDKKKIIDNEIKIIEKKK